MDSSMTCKTLSAAWRSGEIKDEIEISPLLQIQKTFFCSLRPGTGKAFLEKNDRIFTVKAKFSARVDQALRRTNTFAINFSASFLLYQRSCVILFRRSG